MTGVEANRFGVIGQRLVVIAAARMRVGPIEERHGVRGVEGDGRVVVEQRALVVAQAGEGIAAIGQGSRVARFDFQRLGEIGGCLIEGA